MKKIALFALATSAIAAPAMAQTTTTGTVNIDGFVNGRCSVVAPGGNSTQSFSGDIHLLQLDEADGTLKSTLEGTTAGAPAGTVEARVVCTAAQADISVSANTLATGTRGTSNDPGYTNEINYTADLDVNTASTGIQTASYVVGAPVAADYAKRIGRIAAGAANNVKVKAYGFLADTGLTTTLLEAGNYTSTVDVTIAPVAVP